jgi:hypothetical protein
MALVYFFSFHAPEDSDACGEASSPHVVIDVVILTEAGIPRIWRGKMSAQIEFRGAPDSRPAVVHSELAENAFRVGA